MKYWIGLVLLLFVSLPGRAAVIYFPQVVDGAGYQTIITITNPDPQSPATGTLRFYTPTGGDWSLTINGSRNYQFNVSLPGSASARFSTAGTNLRIATGWASLESDGTLSGVATYEIRNSEGLLVESVGVLGSPAIKRFTIPTERDSESTYGAGFSVVNVGSSALSVDLYLLDESGEVIRKSNDISYSYMYPHGYSAKYAREAFPDMPSTHKGTIVGEVSSETPGDGAIAVVGLVLKSVAQSALPVTDYSPALLKDIAGYWYFEYDAGGIEYEQKYGFLGWTEAPLANVWFPHPGPGYIWGTMEGSSTPMYGAWDDKLESWKVVHPQYGSGISNHVYVFKFTGPNTVSGCHYFQTSNGPLDNCDPLYGQVMIMD